MLRDLPKSMATETKTRSYKSGYNTRIAQQHSFLQYVCCDCFMPSYSTSNVFIEANKKN